MNHANNSSEELQATHARMEDKIRKLHADLDTLDLSISESTTELWSHAESDGEKKEDGLVRDELTRKRLALCILQKSR